MLESDIALKLYAKECFSPHNGIVPVQSITDRGWRP